MGKHLKRAFATRSASQVRQHQKTEARRRKMVSDHALLRYIERVLSIDIEHHRLELEKLCGPAISSGARVDLKIGEMTLVIRDGCLVTVYG